MILENRTPFETVWLPGRLRYPGYSLTFVVKGTFDLHPDGVATASEEQMPIGGDEFYPDEEGGSLYYESDLSHFKPRADRLLVGRCYAPGGGATRECMVSFSVGPWSRALKIIGDREWKRGLLGSKPTDPKPFREMDIRYENSFGGVGFGPNPIGQGFQKAGSKSKGLHNVEDPNRPVKSPSDRLPPAGYGPVSRTWSPRRKMIGSYGKAWFKTRSPWFPKDMDWSVCNAAPAASQMEGYLTGTETIQLGNLHPEHPQVESRLPGIRPRAFVERRVTEVRPPSFEEIELRLDTLWIDSEKLKLVLVWRGDCDVLSDEFEELDALYLANEEIGGADRTRDEMRAALVPVPAPLEAASEVPTAAPVPPPSEASEPTPTSDAAGEEEEEFKFDEGDVETELDGLSLIEKLRATLASLPQGPDAPAEIPPLRQELEEAILDLERLERPVEETPEAHPQPWSRERVLSAIEHDESFAEADLSGLDLSQIDFKETDLSGVHCVGANLREAVLVGCTLEGANLEGVEAGSSKLTGAKLANCNLDNAKLLKADFEGADLSGTSLNAADLTGANLAGAKLKKAQLKGANLERVNAPESIFTGSCLDDARATGANLEGADLVGASMERAVIREAILVSAILDGVKGVGADLTLCDLTDAVSEKADFSRASFRFVLGPRSQWTGSVLDSADFTEADLDEADFSKASLKQSNFTAASLRSAILRRVDLEEAIVTQANLFEAHLPAARLTKTDVRGSNLFGADLADADLASARLTGANLKRTRLEE